MKKVIKIFLILISLIVLLGTILGMVDYVRVKNNQKPIFILHISKDGYRHYGLGYAVWINDNCEGDYDNFGLFFSTFSCFVEDFD